MQFIDAVKIGFKKYVDFRGTATRPEYWWFYLFTVLASLIAGSVDLAIRQGGSGPIQTLVSIALMLPQLSLMVRRNRDAGFSARWLLLWLLPMVLFVFGLASNVNSLTPLASIEPETLDEATAVQIVAVLIPVIGPALLAAAAIGIFFFVVSLMPSKKPKPVTVATIDY